jgi:hypothetical protein
MLGVGPDNYAFEGLRYVSHVLYLSQRIVV